MFEYVLGKMKKTVSFHMVLPNPKDAVNEHEPMSCTAQGGHSKFFFYTSIPVADVNQLERIERLATRLVAGIRHLPYEQRLRRLGLHSLQRQRVRTDLITAFKVCTGLLGIDQNLFFFLPPTRRGLRGHPHKALHGTSHLRRRESAFSVSVEGKYWKKSSRLPSLQVLSPTFSRRDLYHWRNTYLSNTQTLTPPPSPPARRPCIPVLSMWFLQAPIVNHKLYVYVNMYIYIYVYMYMYIYIYVKSYIIYIYKSINHIPKNIIKSTQWHSLQVIEIISPVLHRSVVVVFLVFFINCN